MLADIFSGKITKWNDPKIAELNPGSKLPALAIAPRPPCRRVGDHVSSSLHILSAASPAWRDEVGVNDQRRLAGRRGRERQ